MACARVDEDVWVANYNAPGQVVIAGSPEGGRGRQRGQAKELGAKKVMPLAVSGAFHTPYMAPARDRLRTAIAAADLRAARAARCTPTSTRWPTPAATSGRRCSAPSCAARCGGARPCTTSRRPASRTFVELGPGTVLTGMAKRTVTPGAARSSVGHARRPRHAARVDRRRRPPTRSASTRASTSSPPSGWSSARPPASSARPTASPAGRRPRARRRARHRRRPRGPLARSPARSWACSTDDGERVIRPASPSPGCGSADAAVTGPACASPAGARALPDKVVTNADLERHPRHHRRVDRRAHRHPRAPHRRHHGRRWRSRPGAAALAGAGLTGADIDVVVLATTTPDQTLPATVGATCSELLGIRGGAFDLNAACSGFVYGLAAGAGLVATGMRAGAAHRRRDHEPHHRLGRPQHRHPLRRRRRRGRARGHRRARRRCSPATSAPTAPPARLLYADLGGYMQMDGQEVFRRAVRAMVDSAAALPRRRPA